MPRNMHWRCSFCFSARGSVGTLDIRRQIGRKVFFRRLLLVLFVSVLGIALMTGIYFIRLEPEVRFAAVGAVQFFMTVCNSVILGSSFFQRYRVYPRGSALAAVLILMYGVSDFFMPREVKYVVLAASVIGGFCPQINGRSNGILFYNKTS